MPACILRDDDDDGGGAHWRQASIRNFFSVDNTKRQKYYAARQKKKRPRVELGKAMTTSPSTRGGVRSPQGTTLPDCRSTTTSSTKKSKTTRTKQKQQEQLFLDLGQRDFGTRTVCPLCGIMFVHGVAEDLRQHQTICQQFRHGVPFHHPARTVAQVAGKTTTLGRKTTNHSIVEVCVRLYRMEFVASR